MAGLRNSFDIVITTYNREQKIVELTKVLKNFSFSFNKLIVIDSSTKLNDYLARDNNTVYVRSSYKNQPYQRFLGYLSSESEWILFLDDDMEPLSDSIVKLADLIKYHPDKGMICLSFKNKTPQTFIGRAPRSIFNRFTEKEIFSCFKKLSGYPSLFQGEYYKNGVKRPLGSDSIQCEHCSGGAFLAQRCFLYKNFNMQLFDLYDRRVGKGEDGILSYTVSKIAPVFYCSEQLFWHNDQGNSVYSRDFLNFNKIVAYSRSYLNYEYHRLNKLNVHLAIFSYVNYSFWRTLGLFLNFMVSPRVSRLQSLWGYFLGWCAGMRFNYDKTLSRNLLWLNRARSDINGQNFEGR